MWQLFHIFVVFPIIFNIQNYNIVVLKYNFFKTKLAIIWMYQVAQKAFATRSLKLYSWVSISVWSRYSRPNYIFRTSSFKIFNYFGMKKYSIKLHQFYCKNFPNSNSSIFVSLVFQIKDFITKSSVKLYTMKKLL